MRVSVTNDEPSFSTKRLAVIIKKPNVGRYAGSIITRVLKGGETMTKVVSPETKITLGQKAEWDNED